MQPTAEELSIVLNFISNTKKSYQNSYKTSFPFFLIVSVMMLFITFYIVTATGLLSTLGEFNIRIEASLYSLLYIFVLIYILLILALASTPIIIIFIFYKVRSGWLSKIELLEQTIATNNIQIQHNVKLYNISKKRLDTADKALNKLTTLMKIDHVRAVFPFNCSIATTQQNKLKYIIAIIPTATPATKPD